MLTSHRFSVSDDSQVGTARRGIAEICRKHGLDETLAGKISIVATELGNNLVRHAGGGELILRELPRGAACDIEILAIDHGRGIQNIAEALRDGYSTGGTAGTGLGAVKRLSSSFDIYTQAGKGTVVRSFFGSPEKTSNFEIGGISIALAGESACGDGWEIIVSDATARVLLADGLGHGPFAEEAAREAIAIFRSMKSTSPAAALDAMHLSLGKTRGAAASAVTIDPSHGTLQSSGVGNVAMRIIHEDSAKNLVSDNGTLGGTARRAVEASCAWKSDSMLVMHSDGVSSRWSLSEYPGVTLRHPSIIASLIYRDHRRERDDSTVVVLKGRG
jgi:anti-sigma regulatory factor (Ser/Thr protein kinase)